ncbi:unnamed protein product [Closterium sp. NIES-64]|nr:unnamed protein product [Closterium sp. NIES-64]
MPQTPTLQVSPQVQCRWRGGALGSTPTLPHAPPLWPCRDSWGREGGSTAAWQSHCSKGEYRDGLGLSRSAAAYSLLFSSLLSVEGRGVGVNTAAPSRSSPVAVQVAVGGEGGSTPLGWGGKGEYRAGSSETRPAQGEGSRRAASEGGAKVGSRSAGSWAAAPALSTVEAECGCTGASAESGVHPLSHLLLSPFSLPSQQHPAWTTEESLPPLIPPSLSTSQQPHHHGALHGSGKWSVVRDSLGCDSVVCDSVVCDSVVCDSVVCDSVVCDSVVCDSVVCDSVVFDSVVCDSVVCDSVVWYSVVCDSVVWYSVVCDSVVWYSVVCDSVVCDSVVCDSVVCDSVVFDSVVCDSVVCDSVACDSVVCDSVVCDSVVCDSVVCDSVVCDSVVCDSVACDSVACDSVVCDSVAGSIWRAVEHNGRQQRQCGREEEGSGVGEWRCALRQAWFSPAIDALLMEGRGEELGSGDVRCGTNG